MPQRTKDIMIGEERYQIREFSSRTGSRLVLQLIPNMETLTPEQYNELQILCWAQCFRYQHDQPVPIGAMKRAQNGSSHFEWAFDDLEFDTFTTARLFQHVLDLTVEPFEQEAKKKAAANEQEMANGVAAVNT